MKQHAQQYRLSERGGWYLLGGLVVFWGAFTTSDATVSTWRVATSGVLQLPTRLALVGCGLVVVGSWLGFLRHPLSRFSRVVGCSLSVIGGVCAILLWASAGRRMEIVGLFTQSLRLATPIALGGLAGLLCERSGVVNIALEGMMLGAACLGFTAALYSNNIWVGVLAAMLTGAAIAAWHALLTLRWRVDQIISGMVLNMLAIGATGFIRRAVLLHNPLQPPALLPTWTFPWGADLPILGQLFLRHQPMVYSMLILVLVTHVGLWYTPWGLRTRAVGEHPQAAEALGIHVLGIRYRNVIASGLVAGLGGAWFSLETVGSFEDLMTGGKGFIALAAMIFGKWQPLGALGGALVFGFADALQLKLQLIGVGVPYQFLGMLPYAITMIVLTGAIGRAVPPAASGLSYTKNP